MNREQRHAEIDLRSDAIRDQIEQGDWQLLEQLLASAPEAQRREFYTACGQLLLGTGAEFMRSTLAVLAAPLQDAVALGIAARVEKGMQRIPDLVIRRQLPGAIHAVPVEIGFSAPEDNP